MKKVPFFGDFYVIFNVNVGDFLVVIGEPPPYCDKIPTLWAVPRQIKFWSILNKVGIGSDPPPPLLGPNSQLLPKISFGAFP